MSNSFFKLYIAIPACIANPHAFPSQKVIMGTGMLSRQQSAEIITEAIRICLRVQNQNISNWVCGGHPTFFFS